MDTKSEPTFHSAAKELDLQIKALRRNVVLLFVGILAFALSGTSGLFLIFLGWRMGWLGPQEIPAFLIMGYLPGIILFLVVWLYLRLSSGDNERKA